MTNNSDYRNLFNANACLSISSPGASAIMEYGGDKIGDAGMAFANAVPKTFEGGTAEALGGGKFANGAVTGAYVMMFNHAMHQAQENQTEETTDECVNCIPKEIWVKFMKDGAEYISHKEMTQMLWKAFDPGSEALAAILGLSGLGMSIGTILVSQATALALTTGGIFLTAESSAYSMQVIRMGKQQKAILQNYWGQDFSNPSELAGAFVEHKGYGYYGGCIGITSYYSAHTGKFLGSIIVEVKGL